MLIRFPTHVLLYMYVNLKETEVSLVGALEIID